MSLTRSQQRFAVADEVGRAVEVGEQPFVRVEDEAVGAESGRDLTEVLAQETGAPVDWAALADPGNYLGMADRLITRALKLAREKGGPRDPT